MITSNQYMGQVRRALTCPQTRHEKFMQDLKPLLENFSVENPDASLSDFEEAFGAPEELAQEYMSTLDQEEVRTYERHRKQRRWVSWAIVAVIIVGMAIGLMVKYTKVVETPVIEGPRYVIPPGLSVEEAKDFLLEAGYKRFGE